MPQTLAFDVYGTLIDTRGVVGQLTEIVGDSAPDFSRCWREKQLEYSFRRGLMDSYKDFSHCTRDALLYTSELLKLPLSAEQISTLMASYRRLPAFADAREALPDLLAQGHLLYAFSNGLAEDVSALLRHAKIDQFFADIVSADEIKTFKPNPLLYRHFCQRSKSSASACWLVSGNPFDLIGAAAVGFHTAWIRRDPSTPFDPWGGKPDHQLTSLTQLSMAKGLQ